MRDEITIVLRASSGYDDPANQELLMTSKKCRCLTFNIFEQQKLKKKLVLFCFVLQTIVDEINLFVVLLLCRRLARIGMGTRTRIGRRERIREIGIRMRIGMGLRIRTRMRIGITIRMRIGIGSVKERVRITLK